MEFWRSPAVMTLTAKAKLLLLYLMTGPRSTFDGLSTFSLDDCACETKLTPAEIQAAMKELVKVQPHDGEPLAHYDKDTRVVWVTKRLEHEFPNRTMSDTQREAVKRNVNVTTPSGVVLAFCTRYAAWGWPFQECRDTVAKRLQDSGVDVHVPVVAKPPEPPAENEREAHVIAVLNELTGKAWKPGRAYGAGLRARLKDGYTAEDLENVVRLKAEQWLGNPKMEEYLVPTTLFRPTNFERYIQEVRHGGKQQVRRDARGNISGADAAKILYTAAERLRRAQPGRDGSDGGLPPDEPQGDPGGFPEAVEPGPVAIPAP